MRKEVKRIQTKKYDVSISKDITDKIANYKKNWETLDQNVILEFRELLEDIKEFRLNLKEVDKNEN